MLDTERLREGIWQGPRAGLRRAVEQLAERRAEGVYAVGGLLRDLLLEGAPVDLDLLVEGDGIAFATQLAESLRVDARRAPRFLSAELEVGGLRVDVATARRESYPRPGALPRVEPAGVLEDLERRDFTINTLALGVAGPVRAGLLGHPRALEDLRRRSVRVLHDRSFHDDPTRLLRAVTLETRLGARLEPGTETLACQAVGDGVLAAVSGARLWVEIEAAWRRAPGVAGILRRWHQLGLWAALLPGSADVEAALRRVEASLAMAARLSSAADAEAGLVPTTTLLALAWRWSDATIERWIARFTPPGGYRRALRSARTRVEAARAELTTMAAGDGAPSAVHRALGELTLPELALLGGHLDAWGRDWVVREVEELRPTRLRIGAADLLAHGAVPGPALGAALATTLAAVLDGVVEPGGELDYALGQLGIRPGIRVEGRRRRAEPESRDP